MIVGPAAKRPVVFTVALFDWDIVDAGDAQAHQTMLVELPVLIAVTAEPLAAVVVPFISKAHSDAVFAIGPDFLNQAIVDLLVHLRVRQASIASRP